MTSFQDMALPIELQKALKAMNFTTPTPIQAQTIPLATTGKDVIACAETGSGKTAAFAIPAVMKLIEDKQKHALILAPTRELAQQIADFCRDLIKYSDNISVTALIGGADMFKQLRSLKKNPRIIVATPGRLTDHLHRKSVNLNNTKILVLDEGDRMLDMGFAPQLDEILKFLPKEGRQTSLFTATLPMKVKKLAERYLSEPEQVNVGRVSLPVKAIHQTISEMTSKEKDDRLVDELNKREGSVIIFAKTQVRVDKLARTLDSFGFDVDLIHGGRTQGQRNRAIANFKNGRSRVLCATDVASRGIDIPSVGHVVNYDLPMMIEDYVHRIGRTARNGAKGEAVSFVTPDEARTWMMIAKKYEIEGCELKNPPARGAGGRSDRRRGGGRSAAGRPGGFTGGFRSSGEGRRPSGGGAGRARFTRDRDRDPDMKEFTGGKERAPRARKFDREDGGGFKKSFGDRPAKKFDREDGGGFKKSFGDRPPRKFDREDGEKKAYGDKPSKRYSSKKAGPKKSGSSFGGSGFKGKSFGAKKSTSFSRKSR